MSRQLSSIFWRLCLACGAWQRREAGCVKCSSNRLVPTQHIGTIDELTGQRIDGGAVRVLVELEALPSGQVNVVRLYTDRLAIISHDTDLLRRLSDFSTKILLNNLEHSSAWRAFYETSRNLLADVISRMVRPHWPGENVGFDCPVEVNFRLLNLDASLTSIAFENLHWLEILNLDKVIKRAASRLREDELDSTTYDTRLELGDDGERLRLGLSSPAELVVVKFSICVSGFKKELYSNSVRCFVARGAMTQVLDVRLPASVLWGLAQEIHQDESERITALLAVYLEGRKSPLSFDLPCGDLSNQGRLVDIFLDFGSTNTKYMVRVEEQLSMPKVKSTARLTDEWFLPRYEKARILEDKTGLLWAEWVNKLTSALRRYVGREYRGYLRSIHLTIPQSGSLNVAALSSALDTNGETPLRESELNGEAIRQLHARIGEDMVSLITGTQGISVAAEHEVIARHYLAPLKALHQAALVYYKRFEAHEKSQDKKKSMQLEWDKKRYEQMEYEERFFFSKWFSDAPAGPEGKRPNLSAEIQSPANWMVRLVKSPELLERVILLDAGGLTLDIAVLEESELLLEQSKSEGYCGGEAVSRRLAELLGNTWVAEDSYKWTSEKARLGGMWENAGGLESSLLLALAHQILHVDSLGNAKGREASPLKARFGRSGGRRQQFYHQATIDVYDAALTDLMNSAGSLWRSSHQGRCTVFLTGGASGNPHFQNLVSRRAKEAGLQADVLDAAKVQGLIDKARSFQYPLAELNSAAVQLFSTVHDWAFGETKGAEHEAYDKFAVVGGLLAMDSQS